MKTILNVKNLTKNFGGLCAVSNVSMTINEGELIGLIGPNGAGKTTLFNLLTGVYEPSSGLIELMDQDKSIQIGGLKPYKITNLGVARTFQNIRLFKSMTVLENVKVAMHKNIRYGTLAAILRLPTYYKEEKWVEEKAEELLKEVGLYSLRNELATNLPYGKQRRLEIARALAIQPKILYLDEPAAGMNPQETKELTELIDHIREKYKLTVILIEHDMSLVMKICERIYVLNVHYGVIEALKGISLEVNEGEIVALIGANGAGKTTMMQSISGIVKKTSGDVMFLNESIMKANPKHIVEMGLTQVPEGRRIFTGMSVYENLMMGAFLRKDKDGIKRDYEKVCEQFPILKERMNQDASTLSGGEQQMLAMGRALMAKPKLLLLDEPSMGLAPILVKEIFNIIEEINKAGTTVLLVEQNAKMALSIAHRAYVLETGKVVMSGTGEELAKSSDVQKAYLGG